MGTNSKEIINSWFIKEHLNEAELVLLQSWLDKSGSIVDVFPSNNRFQLHHIEDKAKVLILCVMDEEYMARRWAERLGFTMRDGVTSKEYDAKHGKTDVYVPSVELWREGRTSLSRKEGENKLTIVSGDYCLVTKRTASNAFEILLLNGKEYREYLQNN